MESNNPSHNNQAKTLYGAQCSVPSSSSSVSENEKDIVLESPIETRSEEWNTGGRSRKHMLLKQYWKEQHLRVDQSSELAEEECPDDVSVEKINFTDSARKSINETYPVGPMSDQSPGYKNNMMPVAKGVEDPITSNAQRHHDESVGDQFTNGNDDITGALSLIYLRNDIIDETMSSKMSNTNPLISKTEKCKVCKAPAAKHIHYGAITCFSCRAFFRRSVQTSHIRSYVCRREENCIIAPDTRKSCQKCRFEACLKIGMQPGWVLNDDERTKRFKKRKRKKEQPLGGSTSLQLLERINDAVVTRYTDGPSGSRHSPTRYSDAQPHSSSHDNLERNNESDSQYGCKKMYLKARKEQEITTNIPYRQTTYNTPETFETNEIGDSGRPLRSEIVQLIKVESDDTLMANENANSFDSPDGITAFWQENPHSSISSLEIQDKKPAQSGAFLGSNKFQDQLDPTLCKSKERKTFDETTSTFPCSSSFIGRPCTQKCSRTAAKKSIYMHYDVSI